MAKTCQFPVGLQDECGLTCRKPATFPWPGEERTELCICEYHKDFVEKHMNKENKKS
jgi:hypothetical protein